MSSTSKEVHTDESSTIEFNDLKAVAKHKDKETAEKVEKGAKSADWEVSSNGDHIDTIKAQSGIIRINLRIRYKKGQEKLRPTRRPLVAPKGKK